MGQLSIPQTGQPIDLSVMYDIINSINELYTLNSSAASETATVSTPGTTMTDSLKVSNLKIDTGYVQFSGQTVSSGGNLPFVYIFPYPFINPPVVTATLNATVGSSPAAKNATIVLNNITSSQVEGQINFPTLESSNKSFSGGVSIIAIGKPI